MTQSCAIERRTDPYYTVSLQLTPPTCPVPMTVFSPQPVLTDVGSVDVLQPASTDSSISVDLPWELMWSVTGAPWEGFGREALHTHAQTQANTHTQTQANIHTQTQKHMIYTKTSPEGLACLEGCHKCITYCIGVAKVGGFPITSGHQHQQGGTETETETC